MKLTVRGRCFPVVMQVASQEDVPCGDRSNSLGALPESVRYLSDTIDLIITSLYLYPRGARPLRGEKSCEGLLQATQAPHPRLKDE